MQLVKYSIRLLIATGSLLGFLGGWVLLAHAEKPAPVNVPAPIAVPAPTLAPLPAPSFGSQGFQPLPSQPMPRFSTSPRMRTRGS
jgi:hypothetical protein